MNYQQAYQAAQQLAANPLQKGFAFQALHEYQDEAGTPIFWRIRLKHPDTQEKWMRPLFYDGKDFKLKEPQFEYGKPLYRLPGLVNNTNDIVIICEGEHCVDMLIKMGLLATTSGSADSAQKTDWSVLAGRAVIIWPDHDAAGIRYKEEVAGILQQLNCTIKIIDIKALNLHAKGDVIDWLLVHPEAKACDILALSTIEHVQTVNDADVIQAESIEEVQEKRSQASLLVAYVESNTLLFHDKNNEVYAQDNLTKETRRLDGRSFKDWLVASFYKSTGKSPREQSLREAVSTLSGIARYHSDCHEVYIRVAYYDGCYYLDLGEKSQSRAIEITAGSWKILTHPPVHFLRPEALHPLPEPIPHNSLEALWGLINIPKEARILVIAWLLECLRPETPFPVLELIGEQGSAKSTTQSILRRLIDPNACDLRAAPKAVEDIFVSSGMNCIVSYENISYLSPQMQDALCVLATGGGFSKRKLYSDADESVIIVKRPIVLNGISAAITAQDLIDRSISIETPVITMRNESTRLWQTFRAEHAKLLGALLTIMANALTKLPNINLSSEERPRLIEFVHFGMAIAEAMGESKESFLAQFNESREESIARTIDASPVASAIIEWFEVSRRRTTVLPLKELFLKVESHRPTNTDAWPRSPKGFGDALRRISPALRQMGISCRSLGKTGSYVSWEVKAKE